MTRVEPFAYIASTFATNGGPQYEAWADAGSLAASAVWIARKNTYDSDGNMTKAEWAKDSSDRIATFTNVATDLTALTYV